MISDIEGTTVFGLSCGVSVGCDKLSSARFGALVLLEAGVDLNVELDGTLLEVLCTFRRGREDVDT